MATGLPMEHAARAGGVTAATVRRWLKDRPRLKTAVKVAESLAAQRAVGHITAAAADEH